MQRHHGLRLRDSADGEIGPGSDTSWEIGSWEYYLVNLSVQSAFHQERPEHTSQSWRGTIFP